MSKGIEQSVKERLKNISKKEGIGFNILLETLFLERFLVRLATSTHSESFIFKGGMCLSQYLDIGRETRDLDFLLDKLDSNVESIKNTFEEVAELKNEDSFKFSDVMIDTLSITHKKYPGYRISIQGQLGQIKQKITIDIGVGDVVRPRALDIKLMRDKAPLFEEGISLKAYPPEYIFAEKLEAIIYLDEINGRMKDYHDCLMIIRDEAIFKEDFKAAILDTFKNRKTVLTYIPDHESKLGARWRAFTNKNKIESIELGEVIGEINEFLKLKLF